MASRTPLDKQLTVLIRYVRGDTMADIAREEGIDPQTGYRIRRENPEALAEIQRRLINHQLSSARKLLTKSQDLIERKLNKALTADQQKEDLIEQLVNGVIEQKEYKARLAQIYEPTIAELNAVAKESFTQSQIEDGKPTAIAEKSGSIQRELVALVEAIKSGDEVVLAQMVFNAGESPQTGQEPIKAEAEIEEAEVVDAKPE